MAVRLLIMRRFNITNSVWKKLSTDINYPIYIPRTGEDEETKRKRLVYQSRKRGMTENGIIFSTFIDKYLDKLDSDQLNQYDQLINEPSNEWDIYQWLIGKEDPPTHYQCSVLELLRQHVLNTKHLNCQQPPLKPLVD